MLEEIHHFPCPCAGGAAGSGRAEPLTWVLLLSGQSKVGGAEDRVPETPRKHLRGEEEERVEGDFQALGKWEFPALHTASPVGM